jgi:hypothetical protein
MRRACVTSLKIYSLGNSSGASHYVIAQKGNAHEIIVGALAPHRLAPPCAAHTANENIPDETQVTKASPAVETVPVEVIVQPAPGIVTVTEFEETEVRQVN